MLRTVKYTKLTSVIVLMCFIIQVMGIQAAQGETIRKHIQITIGQTSMLQVTGVAKRVSVGNPAIADYSVISKNEIMILGKKIGKTELYVWLDDETMLKYNLIIYDDLAELRTKLLQVLGNRTANKIKTVLAKETAILKGIVSSQYEARQAENVAEIFFPNKVMNLLEVKQNEPDVTSIDMENLTAEQKAALSQEEKYKEATDKTSRIFKLRHAKASDVKAMFDKMKSKDGYLEIDSRTNSLVAIDKPSIIQRMSSFLNVLDEAEPQIVIEAKVIEVNLRDNMTSAFNWLFETLYSGNNALETVLSNKQIGVNNGNMTLSLDYGKISGDHFAAKVLPTLSATNSRLISSPTTVTMNRMTATIDITDKFPYITYSPSGTSGTLVPEVKTFDAGINLKVTPTILEGGVVQMDMELTVDSFVQNVQFGDYGTVPQTAGKTTKNIVSIGNGNTLVIGGLIQDNHRKNNSRVPFLGKIPYLKKIFGNNNDDSDRSEMLIFVTPKIIYPGSNPQFATENYVDIISEGIEYEKIQKKKLKKQGLDKVLNNKDRDPFDGIRFDPVMQLKQSNLQEIPTLTEKLSPLPVVEEENTVAIVPEITAPEVIEKTKPVVVASRAAAIESLVQQLKSVTQETDEVEKISVEPSKIVEKTVVVVKEKPVISEAPAQNVVMVEKPVAEPVQKKITKRKRYTKDNVPTRSSEARRLLSQLKSMDIKVKNDIVSPQKTAKPVVSFAAKTKVVIIKKTEQPMVAKVDVPKKPEVKIKQTLADKKQTRSVLSTKDLKTLAHSSFMNKINELDLSSTELKDRLSKKEMKNALSEIRKQLSANPTVGGVN